MTGVAPHDPQAALATVRCTIIGRPLLKKPHHDRGPLCDAACRFTHDPRVSNEQEQASTGSARMTRVNLLLPDGCPEAAQEGVPRESPHQLP
jgi:hypothetical protein